MTNRTIVSLTAAVAIAASLSASAAVSVVGVNTNSDGAYAADASSTDLINAGVPSLASGPTYSIPVHFGPTANNDGTVGASGVNTDITFWLSASAGSTYTITYALDTSVNAAGYDINSIQSIHGWNSNSGNQKNQNYVVAVSTVGNTGFADIATVAYLPFSSANVGASTKVNVTEDATGLLATGVDQIRFTYTIPTPTGTQGSPTIREIDVFGVATASDSDNTDPVVWTLSPADNGDDISPDSNLKVTFNEGVSIGSGDITIKNLDAPSQTVIAVGDDQVTVSGTTMTINPNADLDSNTNYAVQIAPTAINDSAGNGFAGISNDTTWNFRTERTAFVITSPVTRQVVQRDGSNLGSIPVAGTLDGLVDRVEARGVAPSVYDKNLGAIWFIGDSITQSNADGDTNGSPRKSLYDLLVADGASFSLTGHYKKSEGGLPATGETAATNLYHYHSGISGSVIGASSNRTDMTAGIPGWWNSGRLASTRPNIVLIMLGTNDINLDAEVANAPNRMKLLVDTVLAQVGPSDPNPAIFVAQIPPNLNSAAAGQRVVDFNNALPAVIATLQGEGKDVTLVDQFTLINANTGGLMEDTLHTNSAGNDVLASQWFEAIKTRFETPSNGTTTAWQTITTNPTGAFSGDLTGVTAGGWYSIEVRSIINDVPIESATIAKVGVGDIYVTCGQSNSANFGSPAGTVIDDRVSAWNHTNSAWTKAIDPMPGANGNSNGGSAWTRLGDLLTARDDVPIAFACLGVGGTKVKQWIPPGGNYPRVAAAMNAFPVDGFRGVLWHQGESDSLGSTTPATYQGRLESIVAQSRIDAGWAVPWFIAEAGFHPDTNLSQEESVVAGQRRAIFVDPLVLPGPVTDDFHLEGKLSDKVHFNAAGLADHAAQWADVLGGDPPLAPKNGDIEANAALADGATASIDTTISSSPSVIGWRALDASGEAVADGSCGYSNPNDLTYPGASDSGGSAGVLANMYGKHVAYLSGSSAGANFLQTRRAIAKAATTYTLTVALGVRSNPLDFGGARLEILANGAVVASASFDKATLDALHGGNASGTFTDASISWTSGGAITANQPLAIRIVKEGGAGTVLDFDNARFTVAPTENFGVWIEGFGLDSADQGFNDDPDGDLLDNGIEAWFGTHPGVSDAGVGEPSTDGLTTIFTHPNNIAPPSDISGFYQWSPDMVVWYGSGSGPSGGPTVTLTTVTVTNTTTVSALASEPLAQLFLRVVAIQD